MLQRLQIKLMAMCSISLSIFISSLLFDQNKATGQKSEPGDLVLIAVKPTPLKSIADTQKAIFDAHLRTLKNRSCNTKYKIIYHPQKRIKSFNVISFLVAGDHIESSDQKKVFEYLVELVETPIKNQDAYPQLDPNNHDPDYLRQIEEEREGLQELQDLALDELPVITAKYSPEKPKITPDDNKVYEKMVGALLRYAKQHQNR
ncbi:hypothetical protein [Gimesia panareensis]|uniref:hypothetical protein n=1 Tax=Gimesia panareensis TaxID=2527978 RepID=UPI001188C870|nr:hypothetical protein [Gimesia panareensis]QDU51435.1 hypothetical protein Pan110_38010 [Gimesia panareensis]